MNMLAFGFEYEWMRDGSLRLRFLSREGGILGQQIVSAEAILLLQMLMGLASVTTEPASADTFLEAWRQMGFPIDSNSLTEAVRIRAILATDGVNLDFFGGEDA